MALTVRTDEEMEAALDALTEFEGSSRQEVIRRAVLDRYAQTVHRTEVHAVTRAVVEQWSDLLQRLAET
jgi:predicted transcriptional regulator